jgi:hypothetical protein
LANFCTKQNAKYVLTDYSFLYLFFTFWREVLHQTKCQIYRQIIPFYIDLSDFGEISHQKTPNILTEYSILYLFFTFWRSEVLHQTKRQIYRQIIPFYFYFFTFLRNFPPKKRQNILFYIFFSHSGEVSHQIERQIYRKIIPFYFYISHFGESSHQKNERHWD